MITVYYYVAYYYFLPSFNFTKQRIIIMNCIERILCATFILGVYKITLRTSEYCSLGQKELIIPYNRGLFLFVYRLNDNIFAIQLLYFKQRTIFNKNFVKYCCCTRKTCSKFIKQTVITWAKALFKAILSLPLQPQNKSFLIFSQVT